MRVRALPGVVALALTAVLMLPGVAAAKRVDVTLADTATLQGGGEAVAIDVTVRCSKNLDVLEAFLYVNQDGFQGDFAGIPVQCMGRSVTYTVIARAADESPYHEGEAHSSAFVLLIDKRGNTHQGQDSGPITIE
jgi:hypothetical protein